MTDDKFAQAERYARSRMRDITETVEAWRNGDDIQPGDSILDLEVLGNRHRDKYHVTVLLGTGGPHDELRYAVSDGSVDSVTYWYADWGYGTTVPLTRDEADTAEAFLDALVDVSSLSEYLDS